jgi:hypothetical protein
MSVTETVVAKLAARLSKAVADRTAIEQLSVAHPELDLVTAYRVQRELQSAAGPLAGWKLGVTSRAKQAQVGLSDPIYGFLAVANVVEPGEPLDTAPLIQPRCEPEIVFVLGRALPTSAFVSSAGSTSATAISAPSAESLRATSWPIPALPPVTTAILPAKRPAMGSLLLLNWFRAGPSASYAARLGLAVERHCPLNDRRGGHVEIHIRGCLPLGGNRRSSILRLAPTWSPRSCRRRRGQAGRRRRRGGGRSRARSRWT